MKRNPPFSRTRQLKIHLDAEFAGEHDGKRHRVRRLVEELDEHPAVCAEVLVGKQSQQLPLSHRANQLSRRLVVVDDLEAIRRPHLMDEVLILLEVRSLRHRHEKPRRKAADEQ